MRSMAICQEYTVATDFAGSALPICAEVQFEPLEGLPGRSHGALLYCAGVVAAKVQ